MRKIIFQSSVSIDGFILCPFMESHWSERDPREAAVNFLADFDTIFYGRKAYERWGVAAPVDLDVPEPTRQFLDAVGNMRKYVFSRLKKHVAGNGMVIHDELEREVRRIRAEEGKNIWFCGGGDILTTFTHLDLIDEYVFTVYPAVLKSGLALFSGWQKTVNLKLINKRNEESGAVTFRFLPQTRIKRGYHDSRSV